MSLFRSVVRPVRRPRSPVGVARARWWRTGLNMPEVISSYGIYALVVVAGIAGAALVYDMFTAAGVQSDLRKLITAIQQTYKGAPNYGGLTVEFMGDSEIIPASMLSGEDGDWEIWIGTEHEIVLTPGGGTAQTLGGRSNRYFILVVGSTGSPIRDVDMCVGLVMASLPGLQAVQVHAAAAFTGAHRDTVTADAGAPFEGTAAAADAAIWTDILGTGANIEQLDERNVSDVQGDCEAQTDSATGAAVTYVFS